MKVLRVLQSKVFILATSGQEKAFERLQSFSEALTFCNAQDCHQGEHCKTENAGACGASSSVPARRLSELVSLISQVYTIDLQANLLGCGAYWRVYEVREREQSLCCH